MASEDYLEVSFVGLVVGGNYVWYLVTVVIFIGLGQAEAKRCGRRFNVINWGDCCYREGGFSLCNTAVL